MIVRAGTVVTMNGPPLKNGAVQIAGDRIVAVGSADELRDGTDQVIDLEEQILLPGLINAHCHLEYTALRHRIPPKKSFTDWIRAINAAKQQLSPNDYVESIRSGLAEAAQ